MQRGHLEALKPLSKPHERRTPVHPGTLGQAPRPAQPFWPRPRPLRPRKAATSPRPAGHCSVFQTRACDSPANPDGMKGGKGEPAPLDGDLIPCPRKRWRWVRSIHSQHRGVLNVIGKQSHFSNRSKETLRHRPALSSLLPGAAGQSAGKPSVNCGGDVVR